jgi:tetratricopeptide (TPR) repeat protein
MNHDLGAALQQALEKQLSARGYDVVDLIAIPSGGDPMVRIRTLQEALEEWDSIGYLVQVRPKAPSSEERRPPVENVYLTDGKMNVPFLIQNAELLFGAGDYALARNVYKAILAAGERTGHAHYWIGRCHEAEGKYAEAEKCYEEAIAYQPSLDAYHHYSALLIRHGRDQQAAEALERALNLKELATSARFDLHQAAGNSWTRAGGVAQAEKHFRAALEINANADAIHSNLGALYLANGRTAEAKRAFQQAIVMNNRNDRALAGIAACFLAEGEKRVAHDFFARALDVQINNPTAVFHLVKCAYELKTYATAARVVEEYMQVAPVNANLMYSLAGLQFHLGRTADARQTCRRILELQPEHAGAADLQRMMERYD